MSVNAADLAYLAHKEQQRREADAFLADPNVDTPRDLQPLATAPPGALGAVKDALVGSILLDAAGFVSIQCVRNAAAIPEVAGLSCYAGGRYGLSRAHIEEVAGAGKLVSPNWERRADEGLYSSPGGAGAVDSAIATVESWGVDWTKVPIFYSAVDFSASSNQWLTLDRWHDDNLVRADKLGAWSEFYGQTAYLGHLYSQKWFPLRSGPWVWGGSGTLPYMVMKQHVSPTSGLDYSHIGCTVDENFTHAALAAFAGYSSSPQEGFTMDADAAAAFADLSHKLDVLIATLTTDPGTGISMEWAVQDLRDWKQKWAAAQIAAAVWASAPPQAQSVLSRADIEAVLNEYIYTPLKQIS